MIHTIQSFLKMGRHRQLLAAQALGLSIYSFVLFRFFNQYARFGKEYSGDINQQNNKNANDISWAIQAVSRRVPWKNVCRHQAYQAVWLCNYYKVPCLSFIGFKKNTEKNEIEAHAWTVAGGRIITGFCNPDEYTVQTVYKNRWQ